MNENANVKTNKASIVKNVLFLAIYTLLMIGATASMLESSGILRTIPFVFILPAAATLFYNKKRLTCALVFVFVLFFALIETGSEKTAFGANCRRKSMGKQKITRFCPKRPFRNDLTCALIKIRINLL